ncbi:MAG: hypothetical protein K2M19_01445 [Muribaculaceae bacterium]|nr:hypothetical protein [Muribaculaceae bacterium]
MKPMRFLPIWATVVSAVAVVAADEPPARKRPQVSPVTTAATTTQSINQTKGDTSRINAAFRARSIHHHRDDGAIIYTDTVTGDQWIDSMPIRKVPKMQYPLYNGVDVSVDVWDPLMRAFGQKFGIIGFGADVNLHNRYFPVFEAGLGAAHRTPSGMDYTYRSPLSAYFKIGMDYNFLYNSNPDYKFFAGVRYGFSAFKWGLDNVTPSPGYWGSVEPFELPLQNSFTGWFEFCLGLRVRLIGPVSAGWMVRVHTPLNQSKNEHGQPWYIPGYGSRGQLFTGTFSFTYTIPASPKLEIVADTISGTL